LSCCWKRAEVIAGPSEILLGQSELTSEKGDWLDAVIGSWGPSSQIDRLLHSVSVGRYECLV